MKRNAAVLVSMAFLIALAASCASRSAPRPRELTGLDRKLSTFAYIEEGNLVTLIVDTRATRYRAETAYIPLEITVANRGLKQLSLARESFTLVDEAGKRYPCVGPRELMESYEFLDLDRNGLAELEGIVFNRFATYTLYPSRFSPTRGLSAGSSLVRDAITLPRFGYLIDIIYFPKPDTPVIGPKYELFMTSADLPDPVFVKFQVR